jgi:hypothetical protein
MPEKKKAKKKGKRKKSMFGADMWLQKTGMDDVRDHHDREF